MAQPWQPEIEVTPALAADLIAHQFPSLIPVHVEPFGVGWDNTAFLINKRYVFRFPHRSIGGELIEPEIAAMPHLAKRLPLRVPDHEFIGRSSEFYPWSFSGYEIISGRTACHAHLTTAQRAAIATPLAAFLKGLHAIPPGEAATWGVKPDSYRRFDVPYRQKNARQRIAYIVEHQLFKEVEKLSDIIESAQADFVSRSDVLEHGDLYSLHLIVDEDGKLKGVIDWGDIHLGDPASDLMIAYTLLPAEARPDFFSIYGPVDQVTATMARFLAAGHTAALVYFAHLTNNPDLLRESLLSLNHVVHL
ncbi:MAG TPA: phosphotransferase [Tepidisphaeraceae bacterium]|jgi:aminoglycoside phosphotransferase (APT) family kinase protein|nr:phosphotransferase [Tepidisphaeraceae bacterium]